MITQVKTHPEYNLTAVAVQSVRDAVAGSVFVKDKSTDYLPNPSEIDTTSPDAVARYNRYLQGAEWDAYPEQTLRSMLGKLRVDDAVVELPDSVAYLNEDTDGDGMSLKAMMQQSASELLQVKWQCLVADYQGLTDVAIEDISVAELSAIEARAVIKAYSRENVIYWHFSRINGKLQMSYLMLREVGTTFDQYTMVDTAVKSYLVLALDEDGNYYQQKITDGGNASLVEGERNYVTVGNAPLKWLPVQFAMDEQGVTGKLPKELGFLAPICDLTYARYQMSAEYKEAMRSMPPTRDVLGLAGTKMDQFKEANGRSYYATGANAVNFLPEGVSVELNSGNMEVEFYERYFTANEDKIRSLGGVIVSDASSDKTATEVSTNAAEQNARLTSIADGIEAAYKRIISYCMMFEGAASQDNIESSMDLITLELNRDFAAAKLTTEEVKAIQDLYLTGLMTKKMATEKLLAGGWLMGDIEQILADLETTV